MKNLLYYNPFGTMKKYISVLTIAALGVLALSCAKEMDVNQDNTGKSISKVFTATLEKDDDVTKTEIQSDKSVNWSVGDKILAVWNGGSKASEALTEGGAGNKQFIVNGMGGDAAFAVYPSSIVSTYDGTDFKVTVPSAQVPAGWPTAWRRPSALRISTSRCSRPTISRARRAGRSAARRPRSASRPSRTR